MKIAIAGGTGVVGRRTLDAARERGHEVVVLTRSAGVDLVAGTGVGDALAGAGAVIDVTSIQTQSPGESQDFFRAVTTNLLSAEAAAGVGHHVALSIVGAVAAPHGYYAGKALQERLVESGAVPWTILRATQFHEFAAQIYGQVRIGPIIGVPVMRSQPVAAREVGWRLVELAEAGPAGHVRDLGGPEPLAMGDMVRRWAKATGRPGTILALPLPGGFGRAMRDGTLLPGPDADLGVQTFDEWLREQPRA